MARYKFVEGLATMKESIRKTSDPNNIVFKAGMRQLLNSLDVIQYIICLCAVSKEHNHQGTVSKAPYLPSYNTVKLPIREWLKARFQLGK